MGTWDMIYNNDTALDLEKEYRVAFVKYSPDRALQVLDDYAATHFGENSEDMCSYVISLALFVNKYGINLPETIERGLKEVDRILSNCNSVPERSTRIKLERVRMKLRRPSSTSKPIKLNVNTAPIFCTGDVIALKIDFDLCARIISKYILLRKVGDLVSWKSMIVPEVMDIWPIFEMYDYFSDTVPVMRDFKKARRKMSFFSEGKMSVYSKRNAQVIGNAAVKQPLTKCSEYIFFSQKPERFIQSILT